jgi:hypothetical protein
VRVEEIFKQIFYHQGRARFLKQSLEARNRVGIGLSYRPARLHGLAELIPWNQILSSLQVKKYRLRPFVHIEVAKITNTGRKGGTAKIIDSVHLCGFKGLKSKGKLIILTNKLKFKSSFYASKNRSERTQMVGCVGDHILQEFNTLYRSVQNLQNC